ncbi:flagellar biosynthesis protein FlhB [Primorskyibacter flagellatus]|uniref:Flagellar biosynthesis protein FlhB n=1 Tax=Primorskyibacter flagellatus TaxID=1387277 RepID=A0A917EI78_9RHOB|nr:flagellar type III secretion system protein FlhB [Primorskyibacter flagellatus]GGE47366.1 flagellar biosynthesis protein FlhB [Primorskyibacter flagellatus]
MSEEDDETKSHEPSRRKLENARRKGEVPRSQDISTAAAYAGLVLAAAAVGAKSLDTAATQMRAFIGQADRLADGFVTDGPHVAFGALISRTVLALSPFFALPALMAIAVLFVQQAFVFAPKKLEPKLSRIAPVSNAKNKFGRNGLFEFAKSSVKLVIFSILLGLFILRQLPEISASLQTSPKPVTLLFLDLGIRLMMFVLVIALSIGVIDYLWQWQEHLRKNRMSDKEMRDEHKETEGDPQLKSERRARAQEIAMSRMIEAVPRADVVITNPTHVAVALEWQRTPGSAPICIAKGQDEMAAKIREVAQAHGVPLHRDPPTARALFAVTDLGQEIPAHLYREVAAAIRFADGMRVRARRGWR